MKSDFKTKLIQHMLNKKDGEKGFTLIELLVVIIIIGILAAIALPSFLNQTSKAKETEAKTYISTINKSQQAYYTEKQAFADSASLALGINLSSDNYTYAITPATSLATATASTKAGKLLKAVGGAVEVVNSGGTLTSPSIVCIALTAAAGSTVTPVSGSACPALSTVIT